MAHKTSCPSSGRLKDSILDRPQFHSSVKQKTAENKLDQNLHCHLNFCIYLNLFNPALLTSCSQILMITLAVVVSLWFPGKYKEIMFSTPVNT